MSGTSSVGRRATAPRGAPWRVIVAGLLVALAVVVWLRLDPLDTLRDGDGSPRASSAVLGRWSVTAVESSLPRPGPADRERLQALQRRWAGTTLTLTRTTVEVTPSRGSALTGDVTYVSFPDRSAAVRLPGTLAPLLGATAPADGILTGGLRVLADGRLELTQGETRFTLARP